MNKRLKYTFLGSLTLASMVGLTACTEKFEEINTDKTKLVTLTSAELPYLFSKAQSASSYAGGTYQIAQNLFADLYSQYFATSATYFPSDRNVIRFDWLQGGWTSIYTQTVPQLRSLEAGYATGTAERALTDIWWVYSFHRLTDYYGPIPYFDAGKPARSVKYDAQDKIYEDFFKKLDAATTVLKGKTAEKPFGTFDLLYAGDVNKWIKFANTLRLRLALRVSAVSPAVAKAQAEAAVAGGVMEVVADDALMVKSEPANDFNGLSRIAVWNEFRMSASMESVLKGYQDPRATVFFQPTAAGTVEGLRNGLTPAQLGDPLNSNDATSNVGKRWVSGGGAAWTSIGSTPQNIMHTAEAYFLRAEGALNGWSMNGTAKDFYEKGIAASMNQWGITDAAAIAAYVGSDKTPIAPGDGLQSPAMSKTPIKWATTPDMQREQVGTQKWLALYPDGIEAWSEFRRTKYPTLYPVANNENADLPTGQRPRRIPFLLLERNTNLEAVNAAESLLGGADKVSTPLWWDKNK
ncbi:SusD/RagB family nutrient-binding outer membrane lipoprotein [Spirosoma fluviale]|uniref:Susd and RagB outer membrane lipoprotein n=1 Tax=Spirosoma fluviale TaxID=1597977 RepID=A0A286GBM7_9BACT|nr:SusD/RagB family nutrient-binding outer membrane lipoprotein [Spirosoma fluviale]SOD92933.1 Susd and RagB outer membrane lipoprotein [Spirosoma fluviale]